MMHLTIPEYEKQFGDVYCKKNNKNFEYVQEGMLKWYDPDAYQLAGPFKGNYAYYAMYDFGRFHRFPKLSELKYQRMFVPYRLRDKYKGNAINDEQLQKRLTDYSKQELEQFERERQNIQDNPHQYESAEYSWRFYICGNDDFSWSMYFKSRADLVSMFRENFRDCGGLITLNYIKSLGFVFTN